MAFECRTSDEPLITLGADMRFLACVYSNVIFQVVAARKRHRTMGATVRFLASMRAHVLS